MHQQQIENVVSLCNYKRLKNFYSSQTYEQLIERLTWEWEAGFPMRKSTQLEARLEHAVLVANAKAKAQTPFLKTFLGE